MKHIIQINTLIFVLLASISCQQQDFSGTYYWSPNKTYSFSNTYYDWDDGQWPDSDIHHEQEVTTLSIQTINISKDQDGEYSGSWILADIRRSSKAAYNKIYHYSGTETKELPLIDFVQLDDTLRFDLNTGSGVINFYLAINSDQLIFAAKQPAPSDISSTYNLTYLGQKGNYSLFKTFTSKKELVQMHDQLIKDQILTVSKEPNNPKDPDVQFFNQFTSDKISLY